MTEIKLTKDNWYSALGLKEPYRVTKSSGKMTKWQSYGHPYPLCNIHIKVIMCGRLEPLIVTTTIKRDNDARGEAYCAIITDKGKEITGDIIAWRYLTKNEQSTKALPNGNRP